ncbi:MAG TPA: Mur ligase family protein [Thermohalobaculum sp.]|nr:Mur ligase family protein [Thermohalobaculum sp.]
MKKFRKLWNRALFVQRKLVIRCRRWQGGRPRIIAVTGSNGKTTTVAILDHILGRELKGSLGIDHNETEAIARALARVPRGASYFIQEVSAEHPGVLEPRLALLRPDIAIVTAVGLDHAAAFRTREAVAAEKSKLVEALPAEGAAILNADDPLVAAMAGQTTARVVTFGSSAGADIRAVEIDCTWPGRLSLTVEARGQRQRIETGLFGKHLASSVLAAIAAALELGVSLETCARHLAGVTPYYQRLSIHRHPTGAWLIADTFKAPAWSLAASFAVLEGARAPRRTLIIGELSDIKSEKSRTYRKVGRAALQAADRVVVCGENATYLRRLKDEPGGDRLTLIHGIADLIDWLDENLIEDEVVLLKSGRKAHLERTFLIPEYGPFCMIERCGKIKSCVRCKKTRGIEGLHEGHKRLT